MRSVAALLVVDVTEDKMTLAGAMQVVPVVNLLTKRFGYRFAVTFFTQTTAPLAKALETPPDAIVVPRAAEHSWLNPLLQSKGVSTLYVCGVPFDGAVAELAAEAVKIGVAVFVVVDGVLHATPQGAAKAKEDLARSGVSFVESGRL